MVPGSTISIPLVTLNADQEFVDCPSSPVGQLLINAEFYGDVIHAVRLGVGRYRYNVSVPFGFPNGTEVFMYKSATVDGENLKKFDRIGVIDDDPDLAKKRHIMIINDALKTISLDSGIPHTTDIE